MKKVLCLILATLILCNLDPFTAFAEDISVYVDGKVVEFDVSPQIVDGRTIVPMRAIFEALGAVVAWDNDTMTAVASKGDVQISITVGETVMYKNNEAMPIDVPAQLVGNRTLIPARAVAEALDCSVEWDNDKRSVVITTLKEKEIKVIRIGTHAQSEDNPYFTDPYTGNSYMSEESRDAAIVALSKVKEELGVEIQFVQYTEDMQKLLSKSVEEDEPFCELAILWSGSQAGVLSKNVLQPLDKYADIFLNDPEGAWLLPSKTFDNYYLMNREFSYINSWPIVYNITMLEKIPELREDDGTTLYPSEMYYRGEWTWSAFEKYLEIIKDYYEDKNVAPFETNYTYFGEMALHSVGGGIYDNNGASFATKESIEACEYVDKLITSNLVTCSTSSKEHANSGWLTGCDKFIRRETVFTNCAKWRLKDASEALKVYGQSMGIVPFPYPDGENSSYRHINNMGDSVGLLCGIDEETSRLALNAYKMYKVEYYKALAGVDTMEEFILKYAIKDAENFGIDISHPEVGNDNLNILIEFAKTPVNEYSEASGILWQWSDILGKSIYGVDGFEKYEKAIEENGNQITEKLDKVEELLKTTAN